jgi:cell division protease FtsH
MTPLQRFVADHTFILDAVARAAGLADPVAVDLDEFFSPLMGKARRGPVVPLAGVLIRDWDPDGRRYCPGLRFGARLYEVDGVRFARASAGVSDNLYASGYDFVAVARADYPRFYKLALKYRRAGNGKPVAQPPVLAGGIADTLRRNTVDFLDAKNLARIKAYGGRPKRGLLLTGPPGNGKTSACRWVWQQCLADGHQYRFVGPDDYRSARNSGGKAAEAVRQLFQFDRPGIVFFDDFDVALRDRDQGYESDDQAVFLGALDGIEANEGVVYVFTTNCDLKLIDPAIRRPGRLDVVLQFPAPDASLRRKLFAGWHPEIRAAVDADAVVADTAGMSFAEMDEMRNLLVMRFMDDGVWDWPAAMTQFESNRRELAGRKKGPVGFAAMATANSAGRNGRSDT